MWLACVGRRDEDARVDDEHFDSGDARRRSGRPRSQAGEFRAEVVLVTQEFVRYLLPRAVDIERLFNGHARAPDELFERLTVAWREGHIGNQLGDGDAPFGGTCFQDGGHFVGKVHDH